MEWNKIEIQIIIAYYLSCGNIISSVQINWYRTPYGQRTGPPPRILWQPKRRQIGGRPAIRKYARTNINGSVKDDSNEKLIANLHYLINIAKKWRLDIFI